MEQILARLRARGWTVAVHNDYLDDVGTPRVFWMMVHTDTGRFIKSQGRTDRDVLQFLLETSTDVAKET